MRTDAAVWKWVEAKFGPNYTPDRTRLLYKICEESAELVKDMSKGKWDGAKDELGDLIIVLLQVAKYLGTTLEEAVEGKLPELWERLK